MPTNSRKKAPQRKSAGGRNVKAQTSKARQSAPGNAEWRRSASILLFLLGAFLALLAFIPGDSGWAWLRVNLLFAVFGAAGWLLGLVVLFLAFLMAFGRRVGGWAARCFLVLAVLSGMALAFGDVQLAGLKFGEVPKALLADGRAGGFSSGLLSLLFGWTMVAAFGQMAARVVLVLLFAVSLMVLTETTPAELARFARFLWAKRPRRRAAAPEEEYCEEEYAAAPAYAPPATQKPARVPLAAQMAARREAKRAAQVRPAPYMPGRPRRQVDIPLGPQPVQSAPGASPNEPVDIGPGGTFGARGVNEAFGVDDPDPMKIFVRKKTVQAPLDYFEEPVTPFDPSSPKSLLDTDAAGGMLLFGEDDPYSMLGGADSPLDVRNLPEIE